MKVISIAVIISFMLSSCNEKKASVESTSPDNRIKLTVNGVKSDFLSPWTINLIAQGKGLKGNVSFDFFGGDLSDKTISFVWDKEDNCTITFTQKDNTQRVFLFTPDNVDAMWKDATPK